MARKKIMLFIVEGPTEETSLSTVLNRIFSSDMVSFRVVHGDVLTKDFVGSSDVVAAVYDEVKAFCGSVYRVTDICQIVHLIDTDGVFISDELILEDRAGKLQADPLYSESGITTANKTRVSLRNKAKRENLERLLSKKSINNIPYKIHYFSANLEHTLHGVINATRREKIALAELFDERYAEDPNAFIRFMKDSSFYVGGSYRESWSYIKADARSLERHSNFGLLLPEFCDWHP